MVQGNGSQYPVIPISFAIIVFCYLISAIIATLVDYMYDFYLIKFAKLEQRALIKKRVKSDMKRMRNFFKPSKLEKFDREEAKKRLSIISEIVMEKVTFDENTELKEITSDQVENKESLDQALTVQHEINDPHKTPPKAVEKKAEKKSKDNKKEKDKKVDKVEKVNEEKVDKYEKLEVLETVVDNVAETKTETRPTKIEDLDENKKEADSTENKNAIGETVPPPSKEKTNLFSEKSKETFEAAIRPSKEKTSLLIEKSKPTSVKTRPASTSRPTTSRSIVK
jgi:hypothetical protein